MKIYQRNILVKLFFLRAGFAVLLFLSIALLFTAFSDYAVLTIIALITLSFFSVSDLVIYDNGFEIRKYNVAGIIPIKYSCTRNDRFDIRAVRLIADIALNNDLLEPDPMPFSIAPIFSDKYAYTRSKIIIEKNGKVQCLTEAIDHKEYELLFEFYLKRRRN